MGICGNSNCNRVIYIAPPRPTGRPRARHKRIISLFRGVRRQIVTEMFSVGDEERWSIETASAVSAACSMLAV